MLKSKLLTILAIMGIFSVFSNASPLEIGADAPNLTAVDQNGTPVDLGEAFQSGITLVYFYPKADTSGCTAQACSLRDSIEDLKGLGVKIFGVSRDTPAAQKKFQEKYDLPFTLLADADGKVVEAFGVPSTLGFSSRQSFLVRDGKIVWHSAKAQTKTHADEVKAALKNLQ